MQAHKQGALDLPPDERAKAKLVRRYSAVDSLRFSAAAASTGKAARRGKGRVQATVPGEVKSPTRSFFDAVPPEHISVRRISSNPHNAFACSLAEPLVWCFVNLVFVLMVAIARMVESAMMIALCWPQERPQGRVGYEGMWACAASAARC